MRFTYPSLSIHSSLVLGIITLEYPLILPRPGVLQSCSSIDLSCRTNYLSRNPSFQLESFLLFNWVKLLLHYFVFVYYLHNSHIKLLFMMYSAFRLMVVLQIVWFRSRRSVLLLRSSRSVLSGFRSRKSVLSGVRSRRSVLSGVRSWRSVLSGVRSRRSVLSGIRSSRSEVSGIRSSISFVSGVYI